MRTIVLGVGNPLRTDDAVGLHVARLVAERLAGHPEIDVLELWTGGLSLAEAMAGYDRALVVDALVAGATPAGSVQRLGLADLGAARNLACAHDTSLPGAIETWRELGLHLPGSIVVFGVATHDTETLGERLSAPVAGALGAACDAVVAELLESGPVVAAGERP